jgi:hypothetical protein
MNFHERKGGSKIAEVYAKLGLVGSDGVNREGGEIAAIDVIAATSPSSHEIGKATSHHGGTEKGK